VSRHPKWFEWEGVGLGGEDARIMYTPEHTDDLTQLTQALREAGWVNTRSEAAEIAHVQNLQVGWYGYPDSEPIPHACDDDGNTLDGNDDVVEVAIPMTWVSAD